MPSRPTLLFILALPVGAVVYTAGARVMEELFPKEPILSLLIPLFFAGLAMMPLIIPFFDRKARQDLAEYRRQQEAEAAAETDPPAASLEDTEPGIASDANDTEGSLDDDARDDH
jgi:hypothetical protein